MTPTRHFTLHSIILTTCLQGATNLLWTPLPYRSELDRPFLQGIRAGTIYLEDVEDQALTTPYVGIVITAYRSINRDVDIGVRNREGSGLFSNSEFDPRDWFPPEGDFRGDVRTHRFIGFYVEEGIATLSMVNISQVDHLQYGYAIPEPSSDQHRTPSHQGMGRIHQRFYFKNCPSHLRLNISSS